MSRLFSKSEAKKLIQTHQRMLASLTRVLTLNENYPNEIRRAIKHFCVRATMEILRNVPVEEVKGDGTSIKIKLLKENGYNYVSDLVGITEQQLIAIYGIGNENAKAILVAVDTMVRHTSEQVKLKLSVDDKNEASTGVVQMISRYRLIQSYVTQARELLDTNQEMILYTLGELESGCVGSLGWLFVPKGKRAGIEHAYDFLFEYANHNYGNQVRVISEATSFIENLPDMAAWRDFQDNSILFFNVIEQCEPGILGRSDLLSGLSEKLIDDIKTRELNLAGLKCELRKYQEWGVRYILCQERVLLGDEMGLGKTVQAIATMVNLRNEGGTHFVVVCPAGVLSNWCREITKHSDLSVIKVHGNDREEARQRWLAEGGVAVTTFETAMHFPLDDSFEYALAIVDEAHYIKNKNAKRTINVKELANNAPRMLLMTGTALENNVDEMIGLIEILQPEVAKEASKMKFIRNATLFREVIAPVYYRRKREDVLAELPTLIEKNEWCKMNPEEEAIYNKAVLAKDVQGARRVSFNTNDIATSTKAWRLLELCEQAREEGRKIIVFSFFLSTIDFVCKVLEHRCTEPITGAVTAKRRQEIIDEFDNASAGTVLVAQIQSGGTGLNIQSASVVILCEPQLKPSTENQAIARAYRMGQTRNVLVYRLLCEDSVDEKIMDLLESKQKIFDEYADDSVAANEKFELREDEIFC